MVVVVCNMLSPLFCGFGRNCGNNQIISQPSEWGKSAKLTIKAELANWLSWDRAILVEYDSV